MVHKPDYLPFSSNSSITVGQALETCEYLALLEAEEGRNLTLGEFRHYILGEDIENVTYVRNETVDQIGRLAGAAMGSVLYKNPRELAQKINRRRKELNLL